MCISDGFTVKAKVNQIPSKMQAYFKEVKNCY